MTWTVRARLRNTSILNSMLLVIFGAGASFDEILADYPFLDREDILAAIDYAAHQTDHIVLQT